MFRKCLIINIYSNIKLFFIIKLTLLSLQIWVTLDFFKYCSQVCLEICDHLKIMLFRIPYVNEQQLSSGAEKNGAPTRSQRARTSKKFH